MIPGVWIRMIGVWIIENPLYSIYGSQECSTYTRQEDAMVMCLYMYIGIGTPYMSVSSPVVDIHCNSVLEDSQ